MDKVVFSGNSAGAWGGAVYNNVQNEGDSNPSLTNVTFSGNEAKYSGGGMFILSNGDGTSSPILTNVTFSGNKTLLGDGGGMFNAGELTNPQLRNSILWNNMDISGTDTISSSICNAYKLPRIYLVNSLVQGAGDSSNNSWIDDETFVDGGGNIDTNPMFITPVDPSSAPTGDGNLRLKTGSPAVDVGDNAYVTEVTTDLDEKARRVDGDGNGTKIVDMGAYEFEPGYLLTVNKSGKGYGTVKSSPTNINCGNICSAYFGQGIAVKLEANPDYGSRFTGWGGDCTGKGDCEVSIDSDKKVTATFDLLPPEPAFNINLPIVKR